MLYNTEKLLPCIQSHPQCVLANCATDFLLKTCDTSSKLQLHCGLQFPWCTLALRMFKKHSNSLEEATSCTQGPTSSSHCKVHADHVLVTWMKMCITNSFLRQKSWTNISVQMYYTYSYMCFKNYPRIGPLEMGCSTMTTLQLILLCLCKFSSQ